MRTYTLALSIVVHLCVVGMLVIVPIVATDAAMDAVRRWQFTPTLLNGEPVAVVMTVTVAFTLK
jgi:hypothetical protein